MRFGVGSRKPTTVPICRNEEGAACAHAKYLDNPQAFGWLRVAVEPRDPHSYDDLHAILESVS